MTWRSAVTAGLLALATSMVGCDWFSTLSRTQAIQPYEESPMLPPEGAIAIDGIQSFDLSTSDQLVNPLAADAASLARGELAYADFCAVCHGPQGAGDGSIVDLYPAIPALTTGRLPGFSDGYLFGIITKGRGLMPGYARILPDRRWDLVNYLRTLEQQEPSQ